MPTIRDISGQRFGCLTAVRIAWHRDHRVAWECRCSCGATVIRRGDNLIAVEHCAACRPADRLKTHIRLKQGDRGGLHTKYGNQTLARRSLSEVAAILGCSRQAVQQVERTALHKLRLALLPVVKELNPQLHDELCKSVI